jgi:non-homologous end joining protein Ku
MVALGRLVLAKRERIIALEAYDKGLLGTTLRYPYEVRRYGPYPGIAVEAGERAQRTPRIILATCRT